jgi:hypothetical protein
MRALLDRFADKLPWLKVLEDKLKCCKKERIKSLATRSFCSMILQGITTVYLNFVNI